MEGIELKAMLMHTDTSLKTLSRCVEESREKRL